MTMPLVLTSGLVKVFGSDSAPIRALDVVDFRVDEGEIFGLIGPDGAGKTTLLRILAGLLSASSGKAEVFTLPLPGKAEEIRKSLGYMAQRFSLYTDLTVEENLSFFSEIYGVAAEEKERRLKDLYMMTRLEEFRKRPAGKLSGGMKQKLALMCTLIPRPKLLLLDEPTTGVDPISRREFWEILQSLLKEGVSILVSTPYMDEAEWCTRVGLLHRGKLLACAPPRDLKRRVPFVFLEARLPEKAGSLVRDLSTLAASDGVLDSHRLGTRIRLSLRDRKSAAALKRRFKDRIVFHPMPASIEDVFLSSITGGGV